MVENHSSVVPPHVRPERRAPSIFSVLQTESIFPPEKFLIAVAIWLYFVLFALFRMGVKPVMMLNTHRENELKAIMKRVEPKVYFTSNFVLGTDFAEIAKNVIT